MARRPRDRLRPAAVSGGWSPVVHLFSQARGSAALGRGRWRASCPTRCPRLARRPAPCTGVFDHAACLARGRRGRRGGRRRRLRADARADAGRDGRTPPRALAVPPATARWDDSFVDLQRDATVADIRRAVGAGLRSPEHVKRFTTIGTGDDQGRTSGVAHARRHGRAARQPLDASSGRHVPAAVHAGAASPCSPGRDRGDLLDPVRTTPMHAWHVEHGAVFEDVGQWKRPWYYPRAGEDMDAAVLRECAAAREGVAMMDASTLGKIDVQGPDAVDVPQPAVHRRLLHARGRRAAGTA